MCEPYPVVWHWHVSLRVCVDTSQFLFVYVDDDDAKLWNCFERRLRSSVQSDVRSLSVCCSDVWRTPVNSYWLELYVGTTGMLVVKLHKLPLNV